MTSQPFSRRSFMKAAAAAPAVAGQRVPVVSAVFPEAAFEVSQDPIHIVTRQPFTADEVERIRNATTVPVEIVICRSQEEFLARLPEAEVVYGSIRGQDLVQAPRLKWVQHGAAGVDFLIDDPVFRDSPVVLTNQARTYAPGISETAMGLLLCLTRGIARYYLPSFLKGEWKPVGNPASDHHVELAGRTMGIVGLGGIGTWVARRAHFGFDMRIIATDAKPLPRPDFVAELRDPGWFPQMVPQCDVLVAAAPLTPETRRMFSADVFRAMKKSAYFLALSRGELFDDMALVQALQEGWIAGAGLDVFPQEPPPAGHPIFQCPNVVMTPHTSGWSPDRQIRMVGLFAENVRRYAAGLPLLNVVDKQRMY